MHDVTLSEGEGATGRVAVAIGGTGGPSSPPGKALDSANSQAAVDNAVAPSVSPGPARTRGGGGRAGSRPADAGLAALWDAVERLMAVVEKDHAARLERIERDLKWVMRLVTAVLAALLGASAGNFLAG